MAKSKETSSGTEKDVPIIGDKSSQSDQKIGGDVISISGVGDGAAVAAGRGASAKVQHEEVSKTEISIWLSEMEKSIDAREDISMEDKTDLKEQVEKIASEVEKGEKVDKSRLEKLVNVLGVMAPDIFEVAVTTIASPLAGLGLAIKKIGNKAKLLNQEMT